MIGGFQLSCDCVIRIRPDGMWEIRLDGNRAVECEPPPAELTWRDIDYRYLKPALSALLSTQTGIIEVD